MRIMRKAVRASEDVDVAPEATDLLFEAEDVAQLVAEVTGEEVAVEAEGDVVEFTVGEDDVYVVEAEGDEEILESVNLAKGRRNKAVRASRKVRKPAARR